MANTQILLVADLSQSVAILVSFSAFLPQWKAILSSKSSANISLKSWLVWLSCSMLSVFYTSVQYLTFGGGALLVISSTLTLTFNAITAILVFSYRAQRAAADQTALEEAIVGAASKVEESSQSLSDISDFSNIPVSSPGVIAEH